MPGILKAGRGLELRPLALRDARPLHALVDANRDRLRRWLPWPDASRTVQDSRAYILEVRARERRGTARSYGLWQKGALAGVVGFVWIDAANRCAGIGYWLDAGAVGCGLMTRAVAALIDLGFRELGLHRIEIRAGVRNRRSRAIPERLGFRHEGTLRQVEWVDGRFVDHAVYGLVAETRPRR